MNRENRRLVVSPANLERRERTKRGIIATVANAARPFLYLPPSDGRPSSSALQWAEHPEGWLYLTMRDASNSAALPLANLWLDLIVGRLLNSAGDLRRVWLVVDELPVLGRQAKLETLERSGRNRGIAAVLGFQSIAQLRRIYATKRQQCSRPCLRPSFYYVWMSRDDRLHRAADRGTRGVARRDRDEHRRARQSVQHPSFAPDRAGRDGLRDTAAAEAGTLSLHRGT